MEDSVCWFCKWCNVCHESCDCKAYCTAFKYGDPVDLEEYNNSYKEEEE